jgi:hypothetical protein
MTGQAPGDRPGAKTRDARGDVPEREGRLRADTRDDGKAPAIMYRAGVVELRSSPFCRCKEIHTDPSAALFVFEAAAQQRAFISGARASHAALKRAVTSKAEKSRSTPRHLLLSLHLHLHFPSYIGRNRVEPAL